MKARCLIIALLLFVLRGSSLAAPAPFVPGVLSLQFSPDGRWLASGDQQGTLSLWDVKARRAVRTWSAHKGNIYGLDWSHDGKRLASGSQDGTARVWDPATGKLLATCDVGGGDVLSVSFSPDGKRLVTGSFGGGGRVWNAVDGHEMGRLAAVAVAWSPDGKLIAAGQLDGSVKLYDAATLKQKSVITQQKKVINSLAFSRDGRMLAIGSGEGSVLIWDVEHQTARNFFKHQHTSAVRRIAFSGDGRALASEGMDRLVLLDGAEAAHVSTCLDKRQYGIWAFSLAFSPDGRTLATGSDNGAIRLWHVGPGAKVTVTLAPGAKVKFPWEK
jgi:WD40 repeat protein